MDKPHWTTRRGFVAAAGFGGVALYGVWAAYGAAPGPIDLWHALRHGDGHDEAPAEAGDHGGHGAAAAVDGEAFRREAEGFAARWVLPDGTVHPRAEPADVHDGHAMHRGEGAAEDAPIVIPIVAGQWYYRPDKLRLERERAYRLRLLALDVSHGASIEFGRGARMIRLRPGQITEIDLRFTRAGRYLMLCTVYCGVAHERMQATIEVM